MEQSLGTHQKALKINLDPRKYGAFAEIGAGQEVVRWFFRVGGAAGTIAKSMSAYDMTVSDAIYGSCERYVSRQRLETMLDHEYGLLVERLDAKRGAETEFFAFADTVAARNFKGTNECHGWMGIKYQSAPRTEPNEIIMHIRMLDKENVAQQEALGIVGINLLYAASDSCVDAERLIPSLLDALTADRIEVDMIQFSGPDYKDVDHRLLSLRLVQSGLSDAAMFSPVEGQILQPSEVLHKKPILVERGSFRPVTLVNTDMIGCALHQFVHEDEVKSDPGSVVELFEITMRNLLATGEIDYKDFLARADVLAAAGATVLISNYAEYYRLAAYLRRYTNKPIGITMGIPSLRELFDEKYYENLDGGILESFGRLFKNNTKLYVYPQKDLDTGYLTTVQKLKVAPHLRSLYEHLVDNHAIESIDFYDRDILDIYSRDVLQKIAAGDIAWESMVPRQVAKVIKERDFFGYKNGVAENAEEDKVPFNGAKNVAHPNDDVAKGAALDGHSNGIPQQEESEALREAAQNGASGNGQPFNGKAETNGRKAGSEAVERGAETALDAAPETASANVNA